MNNKHTIHVAKARLTPYGHTLKAFLLLDTRDDTMKTALLDAQDIESAVQSLTSDEPDSRVRFVIATTELKRQMILAAAREMILVG